MSVQKECLFSVDDEYTGPSYRNYRHIRGIVGEVSDIADAMHGIIKSCNENRIDQILLSTKTIAAASVQLLDMCKSRHPTSSTATSKDGDTNDLETCIRSVIRATKAVGQRSKTLSHVRTSPLPSGTSAGGINRMRSVTPATLGSGSHGVTDPDSDSISSTSVEDSPY